MLRRTTLHLACCARTGIILVFRLASRDVSVFRESVKSVTESECRDSQLLCKVSTGCRLDADPGFVHEFAILFTTGRICDHHKS